MAADFLTVLYCFMPELLDFSERCVGERLVSEVAEVKQVSLVLPDYLLQSFEFDIALHQPVWILEVCSFQGLVRNRHRFIFTSVGLFNFANTEGLRVDALDCWDLLNLLEEVYPWKQNGS